MVLVGLIIVAGLIFIAIKVVKEHNKEKNIPADFIPGKSCDVDSFNCGDFENQEQAQ